MRKAAPLFFVLILAAFGLALLFPAPVLAQTPSDLTQGLVSCWDFEEESGTRYDAWGSNDLTDNNTVGRAAGVAGYSASFVSANSEKLSINHNSSLDFSSSSLTITAWAYPINTGETYQTIFSKGDVEEYWAHFRNSYKYRIGSNVFPYILSGSTYSYSEWNHFEFTYNVVNGDITLGVNASDIVTTTSGTISGTGAFMVGGRTSTYFFTGNIDTLTIHSRVLSSDDISWLYNSGAGRSCQDIIDTATPPTATPTITATPSDLYIGSLSSGDHYTVDYSVTAGDLMVTGGLALVLLVCILGFGIMFFAGYFKNG